MDGHEGDPVRTLTLDKFEKIFRIKSCRIAVFLKGLAKGLVKGDVSHRKTHGGDDLPADVIDVSGCRKFHQGVGPGLLGQPGLAFLKF